MSEVEYEYGLPDDERLSVVGQMGQAFLPFRFPVEKAPVPTQRGDEIIDIRMDPATGRTYNLYEAIPGEPGEYGPAEFGLEFMPAYRAGKAGLEFFGDLIMDPETRERAANVMKNLPSTISKAGREAAEVLSAAGAGIETLQSPEDGRLIDTAESVLYGPGASSLARLVGGAPEGLVLGVGGGSRAKSFNKMEKEFQDLKEAGMSDRDAYLQMENQYRVRKNNFPIFRDEIEGDLRILIPDEKASLKIAGEYLVMPKDRPFRQGNPTEKIRVADRPNISGLAIREVSGLGDYLEVVEPASYTTNLFPENLAKMTGVAGLRGAPDDIGDVLYSSSIPATTLEQILDHKKLFQEYPELKGYRVRPITGTKTFTTDGSFQPETRTINLSAQPNTPEGRRKLQSTLLHEVQHAIQYIEKQSGGASPSDFHDDAYRALQKAQKDTEEKLDKKFKEVIRPLLKEYNIGMKMDVKGPPTEANPLGQITITEPNVFQLNDFIDKASEYIRRRAAGEKGFNMDLARESVEKLDERLTFDLEDMVGVFIPDLTKLKKINDNIKIKDSEYSAIYYANPGETNARLAQLFADGLPEGKYFSSDRLPEEMADFLAQSRPDVFQKKTYTPMKQYAPVYQGLDLKKDISGPEMRKLGSPSDLRFLVREALDPDRGQINRMYQPSSASSIDLKGTKDSYLFSRLQYLEGTLRENLSPKNRAKADAEKTSIEMELRRRNNPESKAMGGPVGGLDVYFNQMRMM
jgi:hypothetical protein